MTAATFNFTDEFRIEQGVDSSRLFEISEEETGVPVSLVGYSAKMQVRKSATAPDVLLELSTTNGGIALGGTAGTVELKFTKERTAGATWTGGVYDLELTSGSGSTFRFIEGGMELSREVTRE